MNRYIDVDKIPFFAGFDVETGEEFRILTKKQFDEILTANVVEVVRCKDCKWWHTNGCAFRIDCADGLPCADDFCSHGERREE